MTYSVFKVVNWSRVKNNAESMIKSNFRTRKSNASRIRRTYKTYFAFNFSFLTRDKRYNLNTNKNSIDRNVQAKLLEKIEKLSIEEISVVLG